MHPDVLAVQLILAGLPKPLVDHLASCPSCQEMLAAVHVPDDLAWADELPGGKVLGDEYDGAFERSESAARGQALEPQAQELASAAGLLEQGRSLLTRDPAEAATSGRLALDTLDRLPRAWRKKLVVLGLRIRAWLLIAEACFLAARQEDAELAFQEASRLVADDLGSLEEAELLLVEARARAHHGQWSEALALAARSADVAGRLRETPRQHAALELQIRIYQRLGDRDKVAELLALALLIHEAQGDTATAGLLRWRLTMTLLTQGRYQRAAGLLSGVRTEGARAREAGQLLELVFELTEHPPELAVEGLRETEWEPVTYFRGELSAARQQAEDFSAALAALALAGIYLERGRTAELRDLGPTFLAFAESAQLAPRAKRALAQLGEALAAGLAEAPWRLLTAAQALSYAESPRPEPTRPDIPDIH